MFGYSRLGRIQPGALARLGRELCELKGALVLELSFDRPAEEYLRVITSQPLIDSLAKTAARPPSRHPRMQEEVVIKHLHRRPFASCL